MSTNLPLFPSRDVKESAPHRRRRLFIYGALGLSVLFVTAWAWVRGSTPSSPESDRRAYWTQRAHLPFDPAVVSIGSVQGPAGTLGAESLGGSPAEASPKVLIVLLWASWCDVCKTYLGSLDQTTLPTGTVVAAVSIDDDLKEAEQSLARLPRPGPGSPVKYYFDGSGRLKEAAKSGKIPVTLVYDAARDLKGVFVGGGDVRFARILAKAKIEGERTQEHNL